MVKIRRVEPGTIIHDSMKNISYLSSNTMPYVLTEPSGEVYLVDGEHIRKNYSIYLGQQIDLDNGEEVVVFQRNYK